MAVAAVLLVALLCRGAVLADSPAQLPPFRVDSSLPPDIVLNPGQGLGQCHWLDTGILTLPYVSWAYDASQAASGWSVLEPGDGVFDWTPLDGQVDKARRLGKHVWLELHTTEGQTPQWAIDSGVLLVGSRGGTPVPWNTTYQRLLRRAVHALAARYDGQPTIDAVNIMAGGCYGEMVICAAEMDGPAWRRAGYSDEAFVQAVKDIVDIYLEEDYQWEDGSRTHGFLKTPVVLQLGGGLYGHTERVIRPVVEYAISKYGMRVWLKYNGLGGEFDMGWLFREYSALTKVGYEPSGNSTDFLRNPLRYVGMALDQHASYLCLQGEYFDPSSAQWPQARELAARHLGAQIVSFGAELPPVVAAGGECLVVTEWVNRGTAPLMRPDRQGIKDLPASFDIAIGAVDPLTGAPAFECSFTPSVPTTQWFSAQRIRIEQTIPIPASLPPGEYDLRLSLVDPNWPADHERRCFRLISSAPHDGQGRYLLGRIAVVQGSSPSVTGVPAVGPIPVPASPPTPVPGAGGEEGAGVAGRFVRFLRGLLCGWFGWLC